MGVLIDTAIPCGLILNELISNALEHAFPRESSGTLLLGLRRLPDGLIRLEVSDDGIGPPPGFDPRQNVRMGPQTIFALGEEQLKGKITFEMGRGFACRLAFRDDAFRPRIQSAIAAALVFAIDRERGRVYPPAIKSSLTGGA